MNYAPKSPDHRRSGERCCTCAISRLILRSDRLQAPAKGVGTCGLSIWLKTALAFVASVARCGPCMCTFQTKSHNKKKCFRTQVLRLGPSPRTRGCRIGRRAPQPNFGGDIRLPGRYAHPCPSIYLHCTYAHWDPHKLVGGGVEEEVQDLQDLI